MGMEIPGTKEEEENESLSETAIHNGNSATEGEENRAMKEEDEDEDEEEEDTEEDEEVEEDGEIIEAAEGSEQQQHQRMTTDEARELRALKARPSILIVGPPAVGKRSLLNRLVGRKSMKVTSESGATGQGWTIDTKYYTANVSLWMARLGHPTLEDAKSISSEFGRCEALIMVFDLSSPTSFEQVQQWATGTDLGTFDIRLCVGNKADHVPEHFAHTEYRRKLQKKGESSSDPHPEFWDFGINRTEGSSLLDEEVLSPEDRRRSCIEWCSDNGFEYIEACAIDEVFDECMTVDGDLQGVARIDGALSAHMWPGLAMKDGNEGINTSRSNPEQEITSDDDSDYYIEYELLSNGSAEPWEPSGWEEQWSFSSHADGPAPESSDGTVSSSIPDTQPNVQSNDQKHDNGVASHVSEASDKAAADEEPISQSQIKDVEMPSDVLVDHPVSVEDGSGFEEVFPFDKPQQNGHNNQGMEDMEQLMNEMASMRMNMRAMTDQHRREMAARLAMRMASMFKEDESGESDLE